MKSSASTQSSRWRYVVIPLTVAATLVILILGWWGIRSLFAPGPFSFPLFAPPRDATEIVEKYQRLAEQGEEPEDYRALWDTASTVTGEECDGDWVEQVQDLGREHRALARLTEFLSARVEAPVSASTEDEQQDWTNAVIDLDLTAESSSMAMTAGLPTECVAYPEHPEVVDQQLREDSSPTMTVLHEPAESLKAQWARAWEKASTPAQEQLAEAGLWESMVFEQKLSELAELTA